MITAQLIKLIEDSEGFSEKPYLDVCGVPTIGFGFAHYPDGHSVSMQDEPITRGEAETILNQLTEQFIHGVNALVPDCNQNQKDSLVDFSYNLGLGSLKGSALLKTILINPNDHDGIAFQFTRWVHGAGGEVLPGLVTRRNNEVKLYFTPINQA